MNDESEYPVARFIRLDSGDDLISEVVEVGDDENFMYHLINPLKVVYVPSEKSGYVQIAFVPWVFPKIVNAQEFTLQCDKVVIISDVSEKMNGYYWESVDRYLHNYDHPIVEEEPEPTPEESIMERLSNLLQKRTYH